jgi:peroxiredoxin
MDDLAGSRERFHLKGNSPKRDVRSLALLLGIFVAACAVAIIVGRSAGEQLAERIFKNQRSSQTEAILKHMGTVSVGDTLPDPMLQDLRGNQVGLKSKLNRRIMVVFFDLDCHTCIDELILIRGTLRNQDAWNRFLFVSSTDTAELARLPEKHGILGCILYDPGRTAEEALGIETFPFNILVGQNGYTESIVAGQLTTEDIESMLR